MQNGYKGRVKIRITKNWGHTLSEEDQRWLRDIEANARQTWGMRGSFEHVYRGDLVESHLGVDSD